MTSLDGISSGDALQKALPGMLMDCFSHSWTDLENVQSQVSNAFGQCREADCRLESIGRG